MPLLSGALDLVRRGIFSSLQPANMRLVRAVSNHETASMHERYPLLFDPQVQFVFMVKGCVSGAYLQLRLYHNSIADCRASIRLSYSPDIKVGRFTVSRKSRVDSESAIWAEAKPLQCGTFEPGSDV